jgi:hypothetical protein
LTRILHIFAINLLLLVISVPCALTQINSGEVYPSDEEIFEAYLRGDIDYQTYLNLVEIFDGGIDSTELYLLDEIPGFDYFTNSYLKSFTESESEQAAAFLQADDEENEVKAKGYFKYRGWQSLEEDGERKSQYYINSAVAADWNLTGRFERNYQNIGRCTQRALTYRGKPGSLKKIVIGNYTARYGLGLTVGYRGRLFDKGEESDNASWLFPSYGGFNGIYAEGGRKSDAVKWLVHYDQNGDYRIRATALDLAKRFRKFQLEGIFLGAMVDNRVTGVEYRHYQLGISAQYRVRAGQAGLELAFPKGARTIFPSALLESEYTQGPVRLRFSAWHYDREFLNLTGGGRSGLQYGVVSIDTIQFSFRDRRHDQQGLLFKANSEIGHNITTDFSCSIYGKDSYQRAARLTTGLEVPVSTQSQVRLEFRHYEENHPDELVYENQARAEYRFHSDRISMRSYLGYKLDKWNNKYLSCFTRVRVLFLSPGTTEIWLNLDKLNTRTSRIDYFYGYLREAFGLTKYVELAAKYSYRYSRSYSERAEATFFFEAKVAW